MLKWLHHLLNPHCQDCQLEAIEKTAENRVCTSCETLRMQLGIVNAEKRQMLEHIIFLTRPAEVQPPSLQVNPENASPRIITWNVRKQMLEAEDRKQAQVLAEQRKTDAEAKRMANIDKLEKELNVNKETTANA